jgi:hypothetical protein
MRREKLFDLVWAVDPRLEVVDWDQRLRLPMPSRTPLKLFDRLCEALCRLRDSGEITGFEKFAAAVETWVGAWESCGAGGGLGVDRPGPIEAARGTLRMEEDGVEELLMWY